MGENIVETTERNFNEERLENKKSIEKTLEQKDIELTKEIEIALGKNETENVK